MKSNCMKISMLALTVALMLSCSKKEREYVVYQGEYTQDAVSKIDGFFEELPAILTENNLSNDEYIRLSTTAAVELPEADQAVLKQLRESVSFPTEATLLQKVIPLAEVATYMENSYGGTVGGFVAGAGDAKRLVTLYDIYWGLRLDYKGTKFFPEGAGYAVIRFYSTSIPKLSVPYSPAMGGTVTDPLPFGGGGFTLSTVGFGGVPEYKFDGYYAPVEGAELYEVTPKGRAILRSVYTDGKWRTSEGETVKAKTAASQVTPLPADTYVIYRGERLLARGISDNQVHLFAFDESVAARLGMEIYEKGVYRLIADPGEVDWMESGCRCYTLFGLLLSMYHNIVKIDYCLDIMGTFDQRNLKSR